MIDSPSGRRSRSLGPDFNKAWAASAASAAGVGLHFAAFPLLAASVTTSPAQLALVTAVGSLPWLLLALPAGAWVDRGDTRRIMVAADLARAGTIAILCVALLTGHAGLVTVLVTSALLGIGEVFFDCAALAFLPRIVSEPDLERANGRLFTGVTIGQNFIGQLLGGTLYQIAQVLPFGCYLLSSVASAVLLGRTRTTPAHPSVEVGQRQSIGREILDGIRSVRRNRPFLAITLVSAVMNAVYLGQLAILVLYATHVLDVSGRFYGALLTAQAVGGVLGGLVAGTVIRRLGKRTVLLAAPLTVGAASIAMAATTRSVLAFASFALLGLAAMLWNVIAVTYRQTLVPLALLGRANGVYRLVSWGSMPLGGIAFGAMATAWGLRTPFVVGGVLVMLTALVLIPLLRSFARSAPAEGLS